MQEIKIKDFVIGEKNLTFLSGPCVIESEDHTMKAAETLKKMFEKSSFNLIFKSSFDKANRSSVHSFRGPGIDEGLKILEKVKNELDLPVVTDVHTQEEALIAGNIVDMIQIPAFLCRQTDLLLAAGNTKAAVNVKKGQFMAPWDMGNVVEKLTSTNNNRIMLTDRGTSFGYNNLVSDMRAIVIMKQFGFPVCFDASHSVQLPGGLGTTSGGQSHFIPLLAKAAVAIGCNSLFIESHPQPKKAKSDSASVMDLQDLKILLHDLEKLYQAIN